ncbi:MAG: hypothetical protein DMG57_33375 [Acidobacteria bacterium]|nr:MAG: hypothetical protein DMG57_33375 [Acidobacteriota bacterium]
MLFAVALIAISVGCNNHSGLTAGPNFQKRLQEALILAKPGAVIELPEGRHQLDRGLSFPTYL